MHTDRGRDRDMKQEENDHENGQADRGDEHEVVQLGFCVEIQDEEQLELVAHRSYHYSDWDGGQVGGKPVWLNPENFPSSIVCRVCTDQPPMRFVCQIYAPVDFDDGDDRAFHRTLYVFACPACCSKASNNLRTGNNIHNEDINNVFSSSIRVLRCQLPCKNPYYPVLQGDAPEQVIEEVNWTNHLPATWKKQTCILCGLAASKKCPMQNEYFCGALHQREYYQHYFKTRQDMDNKDLPADENTMFPSVYHMTELVVEQEPEVPSDKSKSVTIDSKKPLFPSKEGKSEKTASDDDGDDDDSYDSDVDLEQDDLNQITNAASKTTNKISNQDETTTVFYQRIQERPNCQEQCLRYCRWPHNNSNEDDGGDSEILWIRKDFQPPSEVPPPCPYCGGPRAFEFLIMPQMLHYLLQNRKPQKASSSRVGDMKQLREALEQTNSLLEQAPPEQIPPSLVDARENMIQRVQNELLNNNPSTESTKSDGKKQREEEIDWGVVAVYTCIHSCTAASVDHQTDSGRNDDNNSGCYYHEEFAWMQPSLDKT